MPDDQLLLIDLSFLVHQQWHISGKEPDPNWTSQQVVSRVRALASEHPHAAVCCDSGKSFRSDIDPSYKANRPESIAPLLHQMTLAEEQLRADGFPVWKVKGFEGDDIIASATVRALAIPGTTVLIASSDKDLLQLVGTRVQAKSLMNGAVLGPDEVVAKLGVRPDQVADYLALVGDKSDNIIGARGIGETWAAKLLKTFDSIQGIYAAGASADLPKGIAASLVEFHDRWPTVAQLIALRTDVDIPFAEIAAERTAPAMSDMHDENTSEMIEDERSKAPAAGAAVAIPSVPNGGDSGQSAASAPRRAHVDDFSLQLEPQNIDEAKQIARILFASTRFSQFPNEQAVFAVLMAGRAEGLKALPSMRAFHPTEKLPMAADMIRGKVLSSGKAKYFRCTERTPARVTFETQRGDDPPVTLTYTMAEARTAFQAPKYAKTPEEIERAWQGGNYVRNPADMLVARAGAKLARLVYPDVVSGLYAPEEFD